MSELVREIPKGEEVKLNEVEVRVTGFNSCKDNIPKLLVGTITELIPPHLLREQKDGPAITSAIFIPESTRANKNVIDHGRILFFDIDKITRKQFGAMSSKCNQLALLCYTTHSYNNDKDNVKIRLAFVASREIRPEEHSVVTERIDYLLGGYSDEACFDIAHLYYLPAVSEKNERYKHYVTNNGKTIDIDAVLAMPSEWFPRKKKKNKKIEGRNSYLTSFAGTLRSKGAEFDEIFVALKAENLKSFPTNPLEEEEVKSIADSVSKYEVNEIKKSKKENGNVNLELARQLINDFHLLNMNDLFYMYNGKQYVELSRTDLSSLIVRTLDNSGVASNLAKKDFDEIKFFVENLSRRKKAIVFGKPLEDSSDPADYVNMQNGILKISRDEWNIELLAHTDQIFNIDCLPFAYNPDAIAPLWEKFLNRILPDTEIQNLLGEWIGPNLVNDTSFARFMLFIGDGANGKSVVILIMQLLLGDDAFCSVGLDSMTPENRFGLAPLIGMKANIVGDMNLTYKFAEGLFKEMVSGGIFTADRKHQAPVKVTATARHTFAMNDLPIIKDKSNGTFRRAMSILFNITIPPEEQDRRLITKKFWIESNEIPGIFNLVLGHLKNLIERGDFIIPVECQKVIDDLKEASRPEKQFLEDIIEGDSASLIPCGELYFRYRSWASDNGHFVMSQTQFSREVKRTLKVSTTKNVISCRGADAYKLRDRHWIGVCWKKHQVEDVHYIVE